MSKFNLGAGNEIKTLYGPEVRVYDYSDLKLYCEKYDGATPVFFVLGAIKHKLDRRLRVHNSGNSVYFESTTNDLSTIDRDGVLKLPIDDHVKIMVHHFGRIYSEFTCKHRSNELYLVAG